jgi:putative tricarboxylic transport membrane protein
MFAMGWVGYAMMRHRIPPAPFLIAFILGPLLEDNFRQSMLMSGSDFAVLFRGPITWFFWTAAIVTVIAISRSAFASRRKIVAAVQEEQRNG